MAFPWCVNDKVTAFIEAFSGVFLSDTLIFIVPPTGTTPIHTTYVPEPETKALVIGVKFGKPREYDASTGTIGAEIISPDIGIWHGVSGRMKWHWTPMLESTISPTPYPQLLWIDTSKPYEILLVNNTSLTIWLEMTFYLIAFPKTVRDPITGTMRDPEEVWNEFMQGIITRFLKEVKT